MEKEQHDSMATVQMTKADYAASEVYSTTSEPPPAYRRETSSVRIAKIIGLTVVVSSFILGAFILASSYLQARASCDQMQTLDSILEKELMLETLQELPKAEALLSGRDLSSDNDMQSLDGNKKDTENVKQKTKSATSSASDSESDSSSSDNSFSESDEAEELNRVQIKMPLELSLSDLANAILQQNQKSRMNCVIERRRAEELVDNAPKMTPFGFNFNSEPKKRVTGERMAIFCESGSAIKDADDDDESVEPRDAPLQRIPVPFGAMPQQYPLTHMPQQQMPAQHMMPPQQQQQLPPQIPFVIRQIVALQQQQQAQQAQQVQQPQQAQQQQQMPIGPFMIRPAMVHQFPIPEQPQHQPQQPMNGEIRIHLQRIPLQRDEIQVREIPVEVLQGRPNVIRPIQAIRLPERESQSNFPPREAALLRESFGLTNEDLMNIQRLAQDRIEQELRSLAQEDLSNDSNSSENDDDDNSEENAMNIGLQAVSTPQQQQQQQQPAQPKIEEPKQMQSNDDDKVETTKLNQMIEDDSADDDEPSQTEKDNTDSSILQVGRAAYGRSILTPVKIPVDMTPSNEERPHFVQPRSIREE